MCPSERHSKWSGVDYSEKSWILKNDIACHCYIWEKWREDTRFKWQDCHACVCNVYALQGWVSLKNRAKVFKNHASVKQDQPVEAHAVGFCFLSNTCFLNRQERFCNLFSFSIPSSKYSIPLRFSLWNSHSSEEVKIWKRVSSVYPQV